MWPQIACPNRCKFTLVAFVWLFCTVCFQMFVRIFLLSVFSCAFKLPAKSHIGCICLTFLHCAFSNVSSKSLDLKRQSHIVSSNCLPEQMQSHIGCICLTFLYCSLSNVSSKSLDLKRQSHIGCICLTFLYCLLSNVSSKSLDLNRQSHIGCICLIFSTVRFLMCPKIAYPNRCKVTSVAFFFIFLQCVLKVCSNF